METKGQPGSSNWVTTYRLRYSDDGILWNTISQISSDREKVFEGNLDSDSAAVNFFSVPVRAQYLKLVPLTWHGGVGMRVEVLGCDNEYRERNTETSTVYYSMLATTFALCFLLSSFAYDDSRDADGASAGRVRALSGGAGVAAVGVRVRRGGTPLGRGAVRQSPTLRVPPPD